jgi:hypothetical protein
MKLPDAVIDKIQEGESPVTHAASIEGGEMIIRYTCDGKRLAKRCFTTRQKHTSIGSVQ